MIRISFQTVFLISAFLCSSLVIAEESDRGVGPITTLKLEALNPGLASQGRATFESKCSACHKMEERYVGPALKGITSRRKPEWIMNMVLNPQEMTQKDPTASKLLEEFLVQMTFQNVSQDDARGILEYFRSYEAGKETAKKSSKVKK